MPQASAVLSFPRAKVTGLRPTSGAAATVTPIKPQTPPIIDQWLTPDRAAMVVILAAIDVAEGRKPKTLRRAAGALKSLKHHFDRIPGSEPVLADAERLLQRARGFAFTIREERKRGRGV